MKIVVNTRLLIHNRLDGIGRFSFETLQRITQQHPDDEFIFLFDREIHKEFIFGKNVRGLKLLPPARRPFLFRIWFNWSVASLLSEVRPDVFLSPDGFLPLRTKTPCLGVIHDLNFEHYPEDVPKNIARFYKTFFPQYARKATRIATVSEYSKADIVKQYGIAPEKIDVVYNGASDGFRPLAAEQVSEVRKQYSSGAPYFLFVGSLHPRKNVVRLLQAFEAFRNSSDSQTKMLIVGERYWRGFDLQQTLDGMKHKNDVIFTGRVPSEELHRITAAAHALTYVPYFEGFGIPIVEAMQCDVPVLTSQVTSMPEVGGDAVVYADPFSETSIAEGMRKIDSDTTLRNSLLEKAKQQREKFSWQKSADLLWESIQKTAAAT